MQKRTVSDIGERGLIHIISEILGGLGNDMLSGEDDAVAIQMKDPSILIINTDMLVSTTDVPSQMTLFQAARKAVVMTVSDILVKGAIPKWAVVALGVDKLLYIDGNQGFKGLISGLKAGFEEFGIQYLGGDLNETKEIVISCTIFGEAPYGVIPRSGARPGDIIACTGELGKTGCGFLILLNGKEAKTITLDQKQEYIDSVLNPETPIEYGKKLLLKRWVTASCDSSDGILKTINEICRASNTGAKINWNSLPIAKGIENFAHETGEDLQNLVFNAGEEFIHIFTIPKAVFDESKEYFLKQNLPLHKIGIITSNPRKIYIEIGKTTTEISSQFGYEHFQKK